VLFVAQFVNNPMKGMQYLDEAAKIINEDSTEFGRVEIVALGRDIPYISDTREMAKLYASMDAFVLPSLSENLPNTIMEAMACGTPCVGFRVGGIPEMIDHLENGYLANYKDSKDLAKGILYVLDEANHERLAGNARKKIINCYGEKAVAERYIKIYANEQ
jgi:glycosyltransferase involved in cell wall biosynthesis